MSREADVFHSIRVSRKYTCRHTHTPLHVLKLYAALAHSSGLEKLLGTQ